MSKIARFVDRLIEIVAATALVAATLMILLNVFNRYVVLGWLRTGSENSDVLVSVFEFADNLFSPLSATADEVPGLLLVWIAFLGAYLAYRKGGHISFDMIVEGFPDRLRRLTVVFTDGTVMVFLGILLFQSVRMIMVDGETEIETAEIAQGWFMSIIPIAAVLLLLALVLDIIQRSRSEQD